MLRVLGIASAIYFREIPNNRIAFCGKRHSVGGKRNHIAHRHGENGLAAVETCPRTLTSDIKRVTPALPGDWIILVLLDESINALKIDVIFRLRRGGRLDRGGRRWRRRRRERRRPIITRRRGDDTYHHELQQNFLQGLTLPGHTKIRDRIRSNSFPLVTCIASPVLL
jgi:hypothetical protein